MHADVLIIGAGPSGGAAAIRLVRAGLSVVCLEQGGWPDRNSYRGGEADWELTSLKDWSWDPNIRQNPADYEIDTTDCDHGIATFNGVGGGTTLFNAMWPRMLPSNFRSRSLAGYADDWPLDYAELQPYYEQTDREIGAAGLGGNPAYPPGADPPLPPLPIYNGGLRMARAVSALGWHWWPETNAILSKRYDGRNACVARGTCGTGCNEGAKGSADLTYWRHVVAEGGRLVTGARVTRILLDDRGLAMGAEWFDEQGTGHVQTADVVLLAANGIGTARLLLNSAERRFPDGLANRSGQVGRNLMLHHHAFTLGVFDEPMDAWRGHLGAWIGSSEFYDSAEEHGAPGTCRWSLGGSGATPLIKTLSLGPTAWGENHHQAVGRGLGTTLSWYHCVEDLPEESNRVSLSGTRVDSAGLPIPVVHYRISDEARTLAAWHQSKGSEAMTQAGATTILTPDTPPPTGHLMGTARMGDDPRRSVVDRFGMSHDVPNLGVLDGSVFVTSAGVNPTSTICALAARTADMLIEHRSKIPRPDRPQHIVVGGIAPIRAAEKLDPITLSGAEQERLADLAEVLIPPDATHPGARAVGIGGRLVAAVLRARPDLGPGLRRALALEGTPSAALDRLAAIDAEARRALETVVAGGYYMSSKACEAVGYPGRPGYPVRTDSYPAYLAEGLLDHLISEEEEVEL